MPSQFKKLKTFAFPMQKIKDIAFPMQKMQKIAFPMQKNRNKNYVPNAKYKKELPSHCWKWKKYAFQVPKIK